MFQLVIKGLVNLAGSSVFLMYSVCEEDTTSQAAAALRSVLSETSQHSSSIVLDHHKHISSRLPQVVYGAKTPENKIMVG